ncbi:hypothetical protein [Neobacillus cucumis]|uniref:hypothetical protein n=1 Tax=Neobacillus cucumis TaxID=1740721 RepID=UPI002E1EE16A|nr:hypothetical protein [Neobacillus cucumis]
MILLAFLICAAFYVNNSRTASNELPIQHLKQSKITQTDIGNYISSNHDYWNNQLCWEHYKNFSFDEFNKNYNQYIEELERVINATDDGDLRTDFSHAKDLLTEAEETNDIKPLINVHRIFHDLDVKYNKYSTSDYFGITQYGEKH